MAASFGQSRFDFHQTRKVIQRANTANIDPNVGRSHN